MIYVFYSELSMDVRNNIKIKVGRLVLEILIKTIFWLFWILLGLLKFQCHFWVPWTICFQISIIIFQEGVDNFETEHKICFFLCVCYWCSFPLNYNWSQWSILWYFNDSIMLHDFYLQYRNCSIWTDDAEIWAPLLKKMSAPKHFVDLLFDTLWNGYSNISHIWALLAINFWNDMGL